MLVWGLAAALFPVALLQARMGTRAWGCPVFIPFGMKLAAALFPVALGHSVLGVPCFLLLFSLLVARPLSGVAALWILVTRLLLSRMQ